MKAVIDTNIFIYSLVKDSKYHMDAKNLLFSLDIWFIPSIVFYELYWFFNRKLSPSMFNDMIILAAAEKIKTLASYDKKLRTQAKKHGIKTIP